MGTGRRGGGFVRIKVCIIVYYARCSAIDASCREGVERETRLGRIGFTLPARRKRVEVFGESLRVSTIREGVFDEKKRKRTRAIVFTFPTIPHAKRAPAFPVVLEVFPFDGEEKMGKRRSVSLSRARARVRDTTDRRRFATHLACRFRWNHPGRGHPPSRE